MCSNRRSALGIVASVLALLLGSGVASADDSQLWSAVALTGKADNERLLLWFDGHARFSDDASQLGVSIVRPGIGWRVSDKLDLWLGYARVTAHPGENIDEDRVWQQATYPIAEVFGGKLSGRTRLEQRFRDSDNETAVRLRQFFRWAVKFDDSDYSFVAWNETFFGLNSAAARQRDGFDQNRAFLGFAWQANSRLRAEVGYLNNQIKRVGDDASNHNFSVTLFVSQ